jgi:hypothetical protein
LNEIKRKVFLSKIKKQGLSSQEVLEAFVNDFLKGDI